ncbi:hypothetical protein [Photobacterium leiognathi]|uniref:hypothetical protein n=1 Tax=Photobacterium leiognathi TaxID=553611 RepID=UPI003DA08BF9
MTWWIAFIIAILGWYFTSNQNVKNSARSLINQEIKEARTKLHELIVSCSSDDFNLPVKPNGECFVKMQTYIISIQELDKLYATYYSPSLKNIRIVRSSIVLLTKLSSYESFNKVKNFVTHWFSPQLIGRTVNHYIGFEVTNHTSIIRQSLTDDIEGLDKEQRLAALHLEYKKLCLSYQYVS